MRFPRMALGSMVAVLLVAGACSSDDGDDPTAFCDGLRAALGTSSSIATVDLDDPGSIDQALADLATLSDNAPDEVADEVAVVTEVYTEVLNALGASSSGERDDVLRDMQARLDEAAGPAAALEEYSGPTCGVQFQGPALPTPKPTPVEVED